MNKILIVIGTVILLGLGAFSIFKRPAAKNAAFLSSPSPTTFPTTSPTTREKNPETPEKSDLDAELQKELNQLDQDISAGSKESINDNDFNF